MINHTPLFQIPIITIDINDWEDKKNKILNVFKRYPEEKTGIQNFYTNKKNIDLDAIVNFSNIFCEELTELTNFLKKDIKITNIWTVTYKKGNYQTVHNHGSSGLTGIIYLDYDENSPKTTFIQPWNDILIDETVYGFPQEVEGKLILVPSFINHFSDPIIDRSKKRILSFDITL
jgi:hypothetical protein